MTLSLRELKEYLITKGGYTITPSHNQLADLKALVDNMMDIRNEAPPSTGSGHYSGTNCIGHQAITDYKLSLGDINSLDIKGCSCNIVYDKTAYCSSRTYHCSCNNNVPTCTCNGRTATTCDCQSRTSEDRCYAYFYNFGNSDCKTVWSTCGAVYVSTYPCDCNNRTKSETSCPTNSIAAGCGCYSRTNAPTCDCDSRTPDPCDCQGRTSSCGSRSTTSCTCNGRCACDAEKRFG